MTALRVVQEQERPFYSVATLARRLAVSERTIRELLNRGEIRAYRVGVQRRVDPVDVDEYLQGRRER